MNLSVNVAAYILMQDLVLTLTLPEPSILGHPIAFSYKVFGGLSFFSVSEFATILIINSCSIQDSTKADIPFS